MVNPTNLVNSVNPTAIQNLAQHIAALQKRITELEIKNETTNDRLMGLAKASKERFDRVQSLLSHLEFTFKKTTQDMRVEMSQVGGKLTQNRVADTRLQELIEKHNNMVSQFETRVQQLKQAISGQDMKILELDSRLKINESVRR